MPQQQVVGYLADRWTPRIAVTSDSEQKLMLGSSQPRGVGLLLAPSLEYAHPRSNVEQLGVGLVGEFHSYYDNIVTRWKCVIRSSSPIEARPSKESEAAVLS